MKAVRVKICGLTRGEDVRAAVEAGADALGFVFTPRSKRVLETAVAGALVAQVPAFISRVGLFMDQDARDVENVLDHVPLNLLQFHGSENAAYCRQFGLPYIKAVSMDSPGAVERALEAWPDAAALLLDSHAPGAAGGTGKVFDWGMITAATAPLVLAGGLTTDNVRQAVLQVRPWAVDVSSGVEDAPGIKNAGLMLKFVNEAKCED